MFLAARVPRRWCIVLACLSAFTPDAARAGQPAQRLPGSACPVAALTPTMWGERSLGVCSGHGVCNNATGECACKNGMGADWQLEVPPPLVPPPLCAAAAPR